MERVASPWNTVRCLTGEEYDDSCADYKEVIAKQLKRGRAFWDQCSACREDIIIFKAAMQPGWFYHCTDCHEGLCANDAESD